MSSNELCTPRVRRSGDRQLFISSSLVTTEKPPGYVKHKSCQLSKRPLNRLAPQQRLWTQSISNRAHALNHAQPVCTLACGCIPAWAMEPGLRGCTLAQRAEHRCRLASTRSGKWGGPLGEDPASVALAMHAR